MHTYVHNNVLIYLHMKCVIHTYTLIHITSSRRKYFSDRQAFANSTQARNS